MLDTQQTSPIGPAPWLLVEELTHRVANEYMAAIATLSVAAAKASTHEARSVIATAAERLRQFGAVHHALQVPGGAARIDLGCYLRNVCFAFARARLDGRAIKLTLSEVPIRLDQK